MLFRHSYSEALLSQILGPWTSYHWRILMLTLFPLKMRSFLRLDDNTTLIIRDNVSLKFGMFLVNTPCCIVQMKEGSQKKAYKCRSSDAINICMKRRENGGIDPVVLSSRRRKDLKNYHSSSTINSLMKRRENGGIDPVVLSSRRRKDLLYFILKIFYPRFNGRDKGFFVLTWPALEIKLNPAHQIRNNPFWDVLCQMVVLYMVSLLKNYFMFALGKVHTLFSK